MKENIISYIKDILKKSYGFDFSEVFHFSDRFFHLMENSNFSFSNWFQNEPILLDEHGRPDYLGTCFYMINSLQEHADFIPDKYGRFSYHQSYQYKYSCVQENLVDLYLRKYLADYNKDLPVVASKIFLSHDIDSLANGFLGTSKYLLQNLQITQMMKFIFSDFLKDRSKKNIDFILKMESVADVKSTFFWIVENKYDKNLKIENADYDRKSNYVRNCIKKISHSENHENGLHKSSFDSQSFDQELALLDEPISVNRNHYLRIRLPEHFDLLQESKLKSDCSLGFPECVGYRNSFGLPFRPFNMESKKAYDFLEIPLHIMDTTFLSYQAITAKEAEKEIIDFLDASKQNAIISILWHNDKLNQYVHPEMFRLYKKLLELIYESKIETVLPSELCDQYL